MFTSARTVAIVFARSAGSEAMYCAGVLTFDGGFMDASSSRTKCVTECLKTSQRQGCEYRVSPSHAQARRLLSVLKVITRREGGGRLWKSRSDFQGAVGAFSARFRRLALRYVTSNTNLIPTNIRKLSVCSQFPVPNSPSPVPRRRRDAAKITKQESPKTAPLNGTRDAAPSLTSALRFRY